jgi:GntR family transcriptional regulator/MocR family aminotransferase
MTRLYGARRDRLVRALNAAAGGFLSVLPPSGGMQLLAYLARHVDDREVASHLKQAGVTVRPLSHHFTGRVADRGLFLGFAAWNDDEIDAGADVMGEVLRKLLR